MPIDDVLTKEIVPKKTGHIRKRKFVKLKNGKWIQYKIVKSLQRKEFTRVGATFCLLDGALMVSHRRGLFLLRTYSETEFFSP
jgi:hypothetical protein